MDSGLHRNLLLSIKKSWKMVSPLSTRMKQYKSFLHSLFKRNWYFLNSYLYIVSCVTPGPHVYHQPWWQRQTVSVWSEIPFYSQVVGRPVHRWISHPCQLSPAGAHTVPCDLPTVDLQSNTAKMPSPLASWYPIDWEGLLGPWVANSLFLPYGKLRAWCITIQLQYTTVFRQCDSSVTCSDLCPNSNWCPFI